MKYYSNPKFLFGKYRDVRIASVPRDYLEWYVAVTPTDGKYAAFRAAVIDKLAEWDRMRKKSLSKKV
jgi:hypothetical protein